VIRRASEANDYDLDYCSTSLGGDLSIDGGDVLHEVNNTGTVSVSVIKRKRKRE
jgi:hypothetical protein